MGGKCIKMKVVLLAGGFGTRISEESYLRPKPMIEIGGMPILWHIMKIYYSYGFEDFIICGGYKQQIIKEWFSHYFLNSSDVTFDFSEGKKEIIHNQRLEKWKVTIVNTGLQTMTGGRLGKIREYIGNETFLMTYGDGVSDVNIAKTVKFHKEHGKLATLTAVIPEGRFGMMSMEGNQILSFREKSAIDAGWINGGFMVLEPEVLNYIKDDMTIFEKEPLERLAREGQLVSYKHKGFWQCMDTMRDKENLEKLWNSGEAKWKVWE